MVLTVSAIGINDGGVGENGPDDIVLGHFVEYLRGFLEKAFAAENADEEGVNVLVGLAPELALHVLEEAEGALPVGAGGELLEDEGEVGEGELLLECVEASGNAAAGRKAGELVDEGLDVVAVLALFDENRRVAENEFFRLGADGDGGGGRSGEGGGEVEFGGKGEAGGGGGMRIGGRAGELGVQGKGHFRHSVTVTLRALSVSASEEEEEEEKKTENEDVDDVFFLSFTMFFPPFGR